jgi:hypothetical protein
MNESVRSTKTLQIDGTRLLLDGQPFFFQGLSFFNAIYNPTFNRSPADRLHWLRVLKTHGVNVLRVWCQWDFSPPRTFVDVGPEHTMYTPEGKIRSHPFQTLAAIVRAAEGLEMVIEVTLFSHEKQPNLPVPAQERAAANMARCLLPYRNLILQIWNEDSTEVQRYYEAIKAQDPKRMVTNSPGFAGVLGDEAQNRLLDLLAPHTVRRGAERFWEVAPQQIASLLQRYGKPVIDDEPARTGIVQFGGIKGGTRPEQHIAQIKGVRAVGGYHTYHHDMFQNGYGHPATPPSGIPEPDFAFHRHVFAFLGENKRWEFPSR